jgi:hypothetical protein
LQKHGTDYQQVQHRNIDDTALRTFFNDGTFAAHRLYNEQRLDYEGLKGRLLSSSYVPNAEDPRSHPMLDDLLQLYRQHEVSNQVVLEYDTEMYLGKVT